MRRLRKRHVPFAVLRWGDTDLFGEDATEGIDVLKAAARADLLGHRDYHGFSDAECTPTNFCRVIRCSGRAA